MLENHDDLQMDIENMASSATSLFASNPRIGFVEFQKKCLHPIMEKYIQQRDNELDSYEQEIKNILSKLNPYFFDDHTKKQLKHLNVQHYKHYTNLTLANTHLTIIGAGTAGLLCAYVLARFGCSIDIYESRSFDKSTLRPQNISFKEAEERLKPIMGDDTYQAFFQCGGSLDGHTGKLRISIGAFQEVLLEALKQYPVKINYESPKTLQQIHQLAQKSIVILTAGVHGHHQFDLTDELYIDTFPEYTVRGRTALYVHSSNDPHGYSRMEREGYHWRRINKTVYDGTIMGPDIRRVIKNLKLQHADPILIQEMENLQSSPSVEYTFIFGNDTSSFLEALETNPPAPPVLETHYDVIPMLAKKLILDSELFPIVAVGDLNGSPHPLAAIGTLKFVRNVEYLLYYVRQYTLLNQFANEQQFDQLIELNNKIYEVKALTNNYEVFFSNILSCLYSKKR